MRSLSRKRLRPSAAALCVLSMFSCSYGDGQDKEENNKHKRSESAPISAPMPNHVLIAARTMTEHGPYGSLPD
jgi:hypothetical protein